MSALTREQTVDEVKDALATVLALSREHDELPFPRHGLDPVAMHGIAEIITRHSGEEEDFDGHSLVLIGALLGLEISRQRGQA